MNIKPSSKNRCCVLRLYANKQKQHHGDLLRFVFATAEERIVLCLQPLKKAHTISSQILNLFERCFASQSKYTKHRKKCGRPTRVTSFEFLLVRKRIVAFWHWLTRLIHSECSASEEEPQTDQITYDHWMINQKNFIIFDTMQINGTCINRANSHKTVR